MCIEHVFEGGFVYCLQIMKMQITSQDSCHGIDAAPRPDTKLHEVGRNVFGEHEVASSRYLREVQVGSRSTFLQVSWQMGSDCGPIVDLRPECFGGTGSEDHSGPVYLSYTVAQFAQPLILWRLCHRWPFIQSTFHMPSTLQCHWIHTV